MNQELYKQIKTILNFYPIKENSNLYHLYKYAVKSGLGDMSFRVFINHAKNMGISSKVVRLDSGVKRVVRYDPKADNYIYKVFPLAQKCDNCGGTGTVVSKVMIEEIK